MSRIEVPCCTWFSSLLSTLFHPNLAPLEEIDGHKGCEKERCGVKGGGVTVGDNFCRTV